MKVITFFTEKGGVGKTTLTIMFSSFLAYHEKAKVIACDFDYPSYHLSKARETDNQYYVNPKAEKFRELIEAQSGKMGESFTPYDVVCCPGKPSYDRHDLVKIAKDIQRIKDSAPDSSYLLLDFPGRFLPSDPSYYLMMNGIVDMIVFLADSDRQSRSSIFMLNHTLKKHAPMVKRMLIWNRETKGERQGRDRYDVFSKQFNLLGISVCGTRIRDIPIARRDADVQGFIRSTYCWPEKNVERNAPYLPVIFEEVKARLDGTWKEPKKEIEI